MFHAVFVLNVYSNGNREQLIMNLVSNSLTCLVRNPNFQHVHPIKP